MKKIILSLLLLSSFLTASDTYVHNVSLLGYKNRCIYNNYYFYKKRFYFEYVDSNKSYDTSSKKYLSTVVNSYVYDVNTSVCTPEPWRVLGMSINDYHFLNGLIGLLFGFIFMMATIYLFVKVGTKR